MEIKKRIIFIRHLPTPMNKKGVYIGSGSNPDINPVKTELVKFENKIQSIQDKWKISVNTSLIVSSTQQRCVSTSKIIANQLHYDKKVRLESDLVETNFGDLSGLTLKQIWTKYPKLYERWTKRPMTAKFPNGESYKQVQKRTTRILDKLIDDSSNYSNIIVCSHADVIKMLLCQILNTSFNNRNKFVIDLGSVSSVVKTSSNFVLVESLNI